MSRHRLSDSLERRPIYFKLSFVFLLAWVLALLFVYVFKPKVVLKWVSGTPLKPPKPQGVNINHAFMDSSSKASTLFAQRCNFPDLDPFDPVVLKSIKKFPPINCTAKRPNLVYREGYLLKVRKDKIPKVLKNGKEFKECKYKTVMMKPGMKDRKTHVVYTSPPFTEFTELRGEDEHFIAECFDNKSTVISRSYFAVIRVKNATEEVLETNYKRHVAAYKPKETLSILLLGIDGTSRQLLIRAMPKTRNFVLNVLHGIEFYKYNKISDRTFPNVMPLLTGYPTEDNIFRNGMWTSKKLLDVINDYFLWSDFRKAGYRTAMMLDETEISAFHYYKKGWNKSPVDYYLRPAVVMSEYDKLMRSKDGHCIGDMADISFMHNYWLQLVTTFNNTKEIRPYFGYSFYVRLTHDDPGPTVHGDEYFHKFLLDLYNSRTLNNTLIVFFSDHGPRFGPLVSTFNGQIERKMPFLFLIFPAWFHRKYPNLINVLKINQNRLTTLYDVHETLKSFLNFQAETGKGDIKDRGISLFKEIPIERTCAHAGIPIGYCACMRVEKVKLNATTFETLTSVMVSTINSYTEKVRDICVALTFKSLLSAAKIGSIFSLRKNNTLMYQLSIKTSPNDAIYEAMFGYSEGKAWLISDIIRLNLYRGQADCVNDATLSQFCFCKNIMAKEGAGNISS